MSITGRSRQPVCALVAALFVAGCGSQAGGSAPAGTTTAPVSTSAPSTTTTPTSTPTSTTTTPPPPPPTAADGTNYKACKDGTCEVSVSDPVRIAAGGGTLSVTKVSPDDGVDFKLTLAGGSWSGTLKGTCGSIFRFYRSGGTSTVTCGASGIPEQPTAEPGALSMQLAGFANGAAVLRLVSG